MKMADVDIDPFGIHDKMNEWPDEPMAETIPLNPGGVGTRVRNIIWRENPNDHAQRSTG